MKSKLTLILALFTAAIGLWAMGMPERLGWSVGGKTGQARVSAAAGPGNPVVAKSAQQMFHAPDLEAMIRHEVNLYGVEISAPGRYVQKGQGSGRVRLELKASWEDEVASLLRVSDGRFLYTRVDTPDGSTLSRVDLDSIRREITTPNPDPRGFSSDWMMGGLSYLLERIEQDFAFADPEAGRVGANQVLILDGVWREPALRRAFAALRGQVEDATDVDPNQLPPHLPTRVRLTLGQVEGLPLFPYQIQFLRDESSPQGPTETVLASLEFLHLRLSVPIADEEFNYQPGDEEIAYDTEKYLEVLRHRFANGTKLR